MVRMAIACGHHRVGRYITRMHKHSGLVRIVIRVRLGAKGKSHDGGSNSKLDSIHCSSPTVERAEQGVLYDVSKDRSSCRESI